MGRLLHCNNERVKSIDWQVLWAGVDWTGSSFVQRYLSVPRQTAVGGHAKSIYERTMMRDLAETLHRRKQRPRAQSWACFINSLYWHALKAAWLLVKSTQRDPIATNQSKQCLLRPYATNFSFLCIPIESSKNLRCLYEGFFFSKAGNRGTNSRYFLTRVSDLAQDVWKLHHTSVKFPIPLSFWNALGKTKKRTHPIIPLPGITWTLYVVYATIKHRAFTKINNKNSIP